jgi:N-acetylmuramic acid 6-phosphate (MurNAc-6-P) etherase
MNTTNSWDVMPCIPGGVFQKLGGNYCIRLHDGRTADFVTISIRLQENTSQKTVIFTVTIVMIDLNTLHNNTIVSRQPFKTTS